MKKIAFFAVGLLLLGAGCSSNFDTNTLPESMTTTQTDTREIPPVENNDTKPSMAETVSGVYTITDVAKHNSEKDCYTAVNGSVYDVTAWISKHPGGKKAILAICGKDGTAAFEGKHAGQPKPENELRSFKIGTLAK